MLSSVFGKWYTLSFRYPIRSDNEIPTIPCACITKEGVLVNVAVVFVRWVTVGWAEART